MNRRYESGKNIKKVITEVKTVPNEKKKKDDFFS